MKKLKNNPVFALFGIGFLIMSLAVAYFFVLALPKIQMDKQALDYQKFLNEQTVKLADEQKYSDCSSEAKAEAIKVLKSRVDLAQSAGYEPNDIMVEASKKDMYKIDDYNNLYNDCLKKHGLPQK